ncbi:alpha,alpha-trehalose-phosphate synthase (UDP-forming) [Iamia sp.]|uniref:alpha,alpha-trehalose-phosphate synthase (UDP-forming) n=1 Tax=Iamia sp. TaxID=2722710 RepID=UPI002B79CC66|nr:trehalose-6-phosphate synthase [Iamia sp.]HXH55941.1 trehalose-6-phosphate synthase [Iamia sp.]
MTERQVVIVSNRGPIAFHHAPDGGLVGRRGAGGLVSGLAPLVAGSDTIWVAAALSDADREAAADGVVTSDGLRVRTVALDPDDLRRAYDTVSNETLWFAHHGMFDHYREPTFGSAWFEAWEAYRRINTTFAEAVADLAPDRAVVLVQDYHLTLVASALARSRPDLTCVHFSHTPFARPAELAVLPQRVRHELMGGLAAHQACGFHSERWAGAARGCARAAGHALTTFVAPLGPDPDDLAASAAAPSCTAALARLDEAVGDRRFLVRVDRIELSKNILRGFQAYGELLAAHPEWRGRVVFGAFVYPSREGVAAYRRYTTDVERVITEINDTWGTDDWTPIAYEPGDDYLRSIAALRRADAVVVNPIRDGLNLVAKEAVVLSDRDSVLLLSEGAGAWDELGEDAVRIDAHDLVAAAESLHRALAMDAGERSQRAARLRRTVAERTPAAWLADQLAQA